MKNADLQSCRLSLLILAATNIVFPKVYSAYPVNPAPGQPSSTNQPSTGNSPVTFSFDPPTARLVSAPSSTFTHISFSGFGPAKPTPVSQPEQATMDPRTLCVAMHDFYQLNPSNTAMSAVQLEIAIRQAFPTIRVDAGSDVNESCPRVRKELVDVFVQKLQQKLAQLPPFEAFA